MYSKYLRLLHNLSEKTPDIEEAVDSLEEIVKSEYKEKLFNCKIIVDAANGAWSQFAKKYFEGNKINVELLNASPEGENINHNCGVAEIEGHTKFEPKELSASPEVIRRIYEQGRAFKQNVYGIAVDGDGDRGFVLKYDRQNDSVVVFDGDAEAYLIEQLIYDKSHAKKNAVFTIESDLMVGLEMQEKFGVVPQMVDVGDKWICNQDAQKLAVGFESSGHVIIPYKIQNKEKILLTGNGLVTALLTIASLESGNESFTKGYSKTLYTYFVKKELFSNGSTLWNRDAEIIKTEIEKLPQMSLESVQMKDCNVLVFYILNDNKKCGLIFIRNSGTEDKNAIYLKCKDGFQKMLLPVIEEIHALHRNRMLDEEREEVICENKILKIIKEKGSFVKEDLHLSSGVIESALHALVKERIVTNHSDSYFPIA